jgi:simple sugar transport system permease protein
MRSNKKQIFTDTVQTLLAIAISLAIAIVIIFLVSKQPLDAARCLIIGPFEKLRSLGNVFELMIPLIFTALAFCIMLRSRQFNLAVDGAFFIGGLCAAVVALKISLPVVVHPAAAIIAGAIAGMVICLIPAILSVRFKANVLVTSLMLNYIVVFVCVYILNYFLRDPGVAAMSSYKLPLTAKLSQLIDGTRIHSGIIIAALAVAFVYYYIERSKEGYKLRMVGANESFAWYSGLKVSAVVLAGQAIAGMIAGIGGAVEILGMYNRFSWQDTPGYGWDGLMIAIMARQNPRLVPVFAFFLAYIRIGADIMAQKTDVQNEMVFIIQAVIIILVASSAFLSKWKHKTMLRETIMSKEGL